MRTASASGGASGFDRGGGARYRATRGSEPRSPGRNAPERTRPGSSRESGNTQDREDRRRHVQDSGAFDAAGRAHPGAVQEDNAVETMPERRDPGDHAARRLRTLIARLEPMVGEDHGDGARPFQAEQIAEDFVLVLVVSIYRFGEGAKFLWRDSRAPRGRVLHEEMSAGVDALEVDRQKVGSVPALEVENGLSIELARRMDSRELPEAVGRVSRRHPRSGNETPPRRRHIGGGLAEARPEQAGHLLGKSGARHRACARDLMEGQPVGDFEAGDALSRVGRVPADEPRGLSEFAGDVPERRHLPARACDRRRDPPRVDFDEIEDAVILGRTPRGDRRPDDRRDQRFLRTERPGGPFPLEPRERRQFPGRDQPVDDLQVRAVDPDEENARRSNGGGGSVRARYIAAASGAGEDRKKENEDGAAGHRRQCYLAGSLENAPSRAARRRECVPLPRLPAPDRSPHFGPTISQLESVRIGSEATLPRVVPFISQTPLSPRD